jgi:hypothetical protein
VRTSAKPAVVCGRGKEKTYIGEPEAEKTRVLAVTRQSFAGELFGAPLDEDDELLSAVHGHDALLRPIHIPTPPKRRRRSFGEPRSNL